MMPQARPDSVPASAGIVLAIETSGPRTAVAVADRSRVVCELSLSTGAVHNELLLGVVSEALGRAGMTGRDVSVIGVAAGPGMFTSLRVGMATAKGLALAWQVPVKRIGSLEALAETAGQDLPVLTLVDAHKESVYAALFASGIVKLAPRLTHLSEVAGPALAAGTEVMLAGDGSALCRPVLTRAGVRFRESGVGYPSASSVALLARRHFENEGGDDIRRLAPCYLRRTDAELKRAGTDL